MPKIQDTDIKLDESSWINIFLNLCTLSSKIILLVLVKETTIIGLLRSGPQLLLLWFSLNFHRDIFILWFRIMNLDLLTEHLVELIILHESKYFVCLDALDHIDVYIWSKFVW